MLQDALDYASQQGERFKQELFEFLRIPSISTLPEHEGDIRKAAEWLAESLTDLGFDAQICPTERHPVVYAEHLGAGPDAPTVLIYGHYDVQPADPLEEWETDPFEPVVKGESIYARGASDDKGQTFIHLKAAEACIKGEGKLPVNVKFIVEGEEEIGSPHLAAFIAENAEKLAADVVLISDTQIPAPDRPSIVYGMRGIAYFEIEVRGPDHDLHSGVYGGAVHNPANALCDILAELHNTDGTIAIEGFYENVKEPPGDERVMLSETDIGEEELIKQTGAPSSWGDRNYTVGERMSVRPTLDIHGLWSGFMGQGAKTVLPATAHAKLSCRLAPDQDPDEIAKLIKVHFHDAAPDTVTVKVDYIVGAHPALMDRGDPAMMAAASAYERVFGVVPVFMRGGGTIPVAGHFQQVLGAPVVLMGFGLPDDRLHAPNEKFSLEMFEKGIQTAITYLHLLLE